jgi:translation initiation factor 6 (eIF-6)
MQIIRAKYRRSEFIGYYYLLNDDLLIYPNKKLDLDINSFQLTLYQSEMIGLYCILGKDYFLYPSSVYDQEKEQIKNLKEYNIDVFEIKSSRNALANNIHISSKILINPNMEKKIKKQLEDIFGKEVIDTKIGNYSVVGSIIFENANGFIVNYNIQDEELEYLKSILNKNGYKGSLNQGIGYIKSSIIGNKDVIVIGYKTTGIEEMKLREYLGAVV